MLSTLRMTTSTQYELARYSWILPWICPYFPTIGDNLLDLVFTSHPSHKVRCKPLPPVGLKSDHDMVLLETSLQAVRAKPVKCKIYLWKKADTDSIKNSLFYYSKLFIADKLSSVNPLDCKNGYHEEVCPI